MGLLLTERLGLRACRIVGSRHVEVGGVAGLCQSPTCGEEPRGAAMPDGQRATEDGQGSPCHRILSIGERSSRSRPADLRLPSPRAITLFVAFVESPLALCSSSCRAEGETQVSKDECGVLKSKHLGTCPLAVGSKGKASVCGAVFGAPSQC